MSTEPVSSVSRPYQFTILFTVVSCYGQISGLRTVGAMLAFDVLYTCRAMGGAAPHARSI